MDKYYRELIEEEVKRIKKSIVGGRLYGESINEDDIDVLIVASYFLGKGEGAMEERRILDE